MEKGDEWISSNGSGMGGRRWWWKEETGHTVGEVKGRTDLGEKGSEAAGSGSGRGTSNLKMELEIWMSLEHSGKSAENAFTRRPGTAGFEAGNPDAEGGKAMDPP